MSVKFAMAVLLALLTVVVLLCAVLKRLRDELKLTQCQLAAAVKEKNTYARQVQRLTNAAEVAGANRREADEKIDELHSGDAVGNALDELHKPRG